MAGIGCTTVYQFPPTGSPLVEPDRANVEVVLNDMRRIAQMIESYAVDNNVYPKPAGKGIPIAGATFFPARNLEKLLTAYRNPVSAKDPWGGEYLYWTDERAQLYLLISAGSDGQADADAIGKALASEQGRQVFNDGKPSACLEGDIIFGNGSFLAYPRPMARPCGTTKISGF